MYKFSNTFETGLSDHHKLISTVPNLEVSKQKFAEAIDLLTLKR